MMRRRFLAGLAFTAGLMLSTASGSALAQDRSVVVVKVVNFSCPVCRASETQDNAVINAADRTGGQFVYAPIPSEAGEFAREKVYYAVRKQGRDAERRVRESLYKGAQDANQPFLDVTQVIEWLKDDVTDTPIDWVQLTADAKSEDAARALAKAANLTRTAGAQILPTYILVQNNATVGALDINTAGKGTSLLALRDEVINRIGQLASDPKAKD